MSKLGPYECDTCGAVFSTPRGFGAHFDRVTHDYSAAPAEVRD